MGRTENTFPLLLYPIVAVESRLFAKLLLSNRCCIFAYLAVVAQQRVYMPQYIAIFQVHVQGTLSHVLSIYFFRISIVSE
jgi:hypothetical protein